MARSPQLGKQGASLGNGLGLLPVGRESGAGGAGYAIGDITRSLEAPTDGVWLECLGQYLLQADYPELFDAIGGNVEAQTGNFGDASPYRLSKLTPTGTLSFTSAVEGMAISPDGKYCVMINGDSTVNLSVYAIDDVAGTIAKAWQPSDQIPSGSPSYHHVIFSPAGDAVFLGLDAAAGTIIAYDFDIETGEMTLGATQPDFLWGTGFATVRSWAWTTKQDGSNDPLLMIGGGESPYHIFYDVAGSVLTKATAYVTGSVVGNCQGICFSHDGLYCFTGASGGYVRAWARNGDSGAGAWVSDTPFPAAIGQVQDLVMSPDESKVFAFTTTSPYSVSFRYNPDASAVLAVDATTALTSAQNVYSARYTPDNKFLFAFGSTATNAWQMNGFATQRLGSVFLDTVLLRGGDATNTMVIGGTTASPYFAAYSSVSGCDLTTQFTIPYSYEDPDYRMWIKAEN